MIIRIFLIHTIWAQEKHNYPSKEKNIPDTKVCNKHKILIFEPFYEDTAKKVKKSLGWTVFLILTVPRIFKRFISYLDM